MFLQQIIVDLIKHISECIPIYLLIYLTFGDVLDLADAFSAKKAE